MSRNPLPEPDQASSIGRGELLPMGWVDVLLETGQSDLLLTYANRQGEPVFPGDLVLVPLQSRQRPGLVVTRQQAPPAGIRAEQIKEVTRLLLRHAVSDRWRALIGWCARQTHTSEAKVLRAALPPGLLGNSTDSLKPPEHRRRLWVQRRKDAQATAPQAVTRRQQQLLDCLDQHGPEGVGLAELLRHSGCSAAVVKCLVKSGVLDLHHKPRKEAAASSSGDRALQQPAAAPQSLLPAQARALAAIETAAPGQELLLWGVTGSGKTEVYLQAAAACLQRGRDVLMLCPEIGLIPQLQDRCQRRFPGLVLTYHSSLSPRERFACWNRCRDHGPWLVVGTRSAVFLPLAQPGLVVMDEEHDGSYKQDAPMPCYHARDVARYRADQDGARLVLGSATPSLETWRRCQTGNCRLLRLPERVLGRCLPSIRVVDMRQELARGQRSVVSTQLRERLEQVRIQGEQSILLVPRRGYSPFLSCRSCGEAVMCPQCDISLTVHRQRSGAGYRDFLRCHWCNHRQAVGDRCNHCGSTAFKPFGTGTQRVEEQLQEQLGDARLLRYDHDTTRGKDGHRRVLQRFASGAADVLVGTQMVAKGIDLPNVTLAAVLAADGLLHRPDLRAEEEALQLFFQLAGRAGRGTKPGEVVLQTYTPDHAVVRCWLDGRYDRFLDAELHNRHQHGLVPYARACLLRLSGSSSGATANAAALLAESLAPQLRDRGWSLVGPAPAPVARVARRSRWQVLLHGPEGPLPFEADQDLRAMLPRGVALTIDPDPLNL